MRYASGILTRIVNGPALDGSPSRTAACAPGGREGGAAAQLTVDGVNMMWALPSVWLYVIAAVQNTAATIIVAAAMNFVPIDTSLSRKKGFPAPVLPGPDLR